MGMFRQSFLLKSTLSLLFITTRCHLFASHSAVSPAFERNDLHFFKARLFLWMMNKSFHRMYPRSLFLETSKVMKGCDETHEKICSWKAAREEKAGTWLSIHRHMQNRVLVKLLMRWETVLANFLPVRWLSFCIHDINAFKSRSLIFHRNLCELPTFLANVHSNFHLFNAELDCRPQIPFHRALLSLITLWIRSCRLMWIVCNEFGIQITKSLKQSSMMVFYLKQTFHGVW